MMVNRVLLVDNTLYLTFELFTLLSLVVIVPALEEWVVLPFVRLFSF